MTGAARDPGISANFRYTTSTDMTTQVLVSSKEVSTLDGAAACERG
jgi:hypothetical protein